MPTSTVQLKSPYVALAKRMLAKLSLTRDVRLRTDISDDAEVKAMYCFCSGWYKLKRYAMQRYTAFQLFNMDPSLTFG